MIKLPLYLDGAMVDNGRKMTKAEARRLVKSAYGEEADVIQTEGTERGAYSKEWRAMRRLQDSPLGWSPRAWQNFNWHKAGRRRNPVDEPASI